MADTKFSCFKQKRDWGREGRTAVSLHGHTNRSKESLHFIPKLAQKCPMLHAALQKQCRRARIPVDFARAYWTPPLNPKLAYEAERNQIVSVLGLNSLVSLTDHDSIEAPTALRIAAETAHVPIALEWSVPFEQRIFHLGVHNLPEDAAQSLVPDLFAYTQKPDDKRLLELLSMLDGLPDVLVVFNHPLWNQSCPGAPRDDQAVDRFLRIAANFLHAFELNAMRGSKENNAAAQLADRWQKPFISGGDRHGCEPNGALNLTGAESFVEFVHEIRRERRSHVLLMPQYSEPKNVRTLRTLLDVIRDYPEYPAGSQRWDERVFHPDDANGGDRPISTLWKTPPAFVERIFSGVRVVEHVTVQWALRRFFRGALGSDLPAEVPSQAAS